MIVGVCMYIRLLLYFVYINNYIVGLLSSLSAVKTWKLRALNVLKA